MGKKIIHKPIYQEGDFVLVYDRAWKIITRRMSLKGVHTWQPPELFLIREVADPLKNIWVTANGITRKLTEEEKTAETLRAH